MVEKAHRPGSSAPFPIPQGVQWEVGKSVLGQDAQTRPTAPQPPPGVGEPTQAWHIPADEDPTRAVPAVPHTGVPGAPHDDGRITAPMPQPPADNRPTRPVGPITVAPESPWGRPTDSQFAVLESIPWILETFGQTWQDIGYFSPPLRLASAVTADVSPQDVATVGTIATIGAGLLYALTVTEGFFASIAGALTPKSKWEEMAAPRPPSA